jgi:TolA-binding protein
MDDLAGSVARHSPPANGPAKSLSWAGVLLLALGIAGTAFGDAADDQFAVAAGHYKLERWQLAHDEFQVFLAQHAGHERATSAKFYLGETLVQLRRFEAAAQQFGELLEASPPDTLKRKAQFRLGESHYFARQWDDARTALAVIADEPSSEDINAYALAYLADIALETSDGPEAEKLYRQALARFGQGPLADDFRLGLARACQLQGDKDAAKRTEALRMFTELMERGGAPAERATLGVAACLAASGEIARAEKTYTQFLARYPNSRLVSNAQLGQAQAWYRLGRLDAAQKRFEALATNESLGVEARYWLAMVQLARGENEKAFATLEAIARDHASHALASAATYHAGEALMRVGRVSEASIRFVTVLDRWPDSPWADNASAGRVRVALADNDHEAVDRRSKAFLDRWPESELASAVRTACVRSLLVRRDFAAAEAAATPLVEQAGVDSKLEAQYLLALAIVGQLRWDDALAQLKPVLAATYPALQADAQRAQASCFVGQKNFREACTPLRSYIAFAEAAKPQPADDLAIAKAQLALCLARTERLALAKRDWNGLLKTSPDVKLLTPTAAMLAETALETGDEAWASELFSLLADERNARDVQARGLSGLAWIDYRAGRKEKALVAFQKLADEFADEATAVETELMLAVLLEQQGKSREALTRFQHLAQRDDATAQLSGSLEGVARLHERLGEHAEAAAALRRLRDEFPQLERRDAVLYNLAWAERSLSDNAAADACFRELKEKHPNSTYWPDAMYRLAERAVQDNRPADARALLVELLAAETPPSIVPHALYLQAQLAINAGDWQDVEVPLARLVTEFPESTLKPLAEFWLAEAAYRTDDLATARQRFDALAERDAGKNQTWGGMVALRRGQLLAQAKVWDEALAAAQAIAKTWPQFEQQYEVDYLIGRCLAAEAKFDEARAAYKRVIESPSGAKTETAGMAQWMIGESFMHQKQYEPAIREYLRVEILYAYPAWQAAALLQAGKCHESLGQRDQAIELYARLLKNHGNTSYAEEAARRLQTVRQPTAKPL